MATIDLHGVKEIISVVEKFEQYDGKPFFRKRIAIVSSSNGKIDINLYSDTAEQLFIKEEL
jgi:hypothetical protein